ncbi:MtnX-like HAD-IB family phosphatase [bacterium]|nr:MtnX-like HAD-IB family phosphatase [bacterium]
MKLAIFCDFDGTITKDDSLQFLLDYYVGDKWYEIENQVEAGTLPENEALQLEMDFLKVSEQEAFETLGKHINIDETFGDFVLWCKSKGYEIFILSGGFRKIIEFTFKKNYIEAVEIFSNDIFIDSKNNWKVIPSATPKINNLCNHCKTYHLEKIREKVDKIVYIGDGTTDRCPAQKSDLIFAKNGLSKFLKEKNVPFFPFENFEEIKFKLQNLI